MQLRKRSNRHCAESVLGRLVPSCVCGLGHRKSAQGFCVHGPKTGDSNQQMGFQVQPN